jgi:hypothetical protein
MRLVHGFFVVSVLLFVTGIGFVIAGARASRQGQAAATPPATTTLIPVASVRQIMTSIVAPAARTVFSSVGTIITAERVDERRPETDAEWQEVADAAAALVESGNLMLMGSRAVDQGEWAKYARELIDTSLVTLKAARAKDTQGVFDSCEAVYNSCNGCHGNYMR